MYGPHQGGDDSAERRGGGAGDGKGAAGASDASGRAGAESLNPDDTTARGAGATGIPGVPVRFRDLAEAYFRRLADENR